MVLLKSNQGWQPKKTQHSGPQKLMKVSFQGVWEAINHSGLRLINRALYLQHFLNVFLGDMQTYVCLHLLE